MKEKLISVVALILMTAPGLASAETTDSFNGSVGLGAIVTDSGNNLNPEGSEKRLDNLNSAADVPLLSNSFMDVYRCIKLSSEPGRNIL